MRAGSADREHLPTPAGEEYLFFFNLPDQHRAVRKIAVWDSVLQVGPVGLARLCHVTLPATAEAATSNRRRLACQQFPQDHGIVMRLVTPSW
jgi:hypothetical protein